MILDYIAQFIVAMIATLCFAIVFSAPKSELIHCGLSGAIGWIFYIIISAALSAPTLGNIVGSFLLTTFSRALAAKRKNPVTVYLISGIFPLVPGAGIYYTSYYLITNNMETFASYGLSTLKTAGAIVMGIILGMAFPQSWFNTVFAPSCHKS
ncbi:MAG: threonine/serine exporter family protein [Pseudobutyrivibrio sp.]|uniref:threonine/serine exporter family protein n=1 Tax=Pseudobutyrivibrio sp. TaxID=2014367 RepID=UPI0025F88F3E|nr:threonine/serine exporter family protein [Pseudobutyrivibrio sp.]MBQ8488542.1 threonine/serine exporter family protein [Pseudobutyrivibrio sp.]